MSFSMRKAWNNASSTYQRNQQIPIDSVYYGPWSPPESQLQLLGDMHGKRVLELGCGGGQAALALARAGAIVTALDVSDEQLQFARKLAARHKVAVDFIQCDVKEVNTLAPGQWDLILGINLFQYIHQINGVLTQCHNRLQADGRLIIALDHPLRSCFIDEEEEELGLLPVRDYFDDTPLHWRFSDSDHWMISYHRTLAEWVNALCTAGFRLQQLVEPPLEATIADDLWPLDGPHAALRNIPQTVIFIATKA